MGHSPEDHCMHRRRREGLREGPQTAFCGHCDLRVPSKALNFLTGWTTISVSRRIVLRGVGGMSNSTATVEHRVWSVTFSGDVVTGVMRWWGDVGVVDVVRRCSARSLPPLRAHHLVHCTRVHSVHSQMEHFAKYDAKVCALNMIYNYVWITYET